MSTRLQTQTKAAPMPSFAPVRPGLLQRKCACGGSPGLTGECAECRSKRLTVQRHTTNLAEPSTVPPIVHDVLRSSGQPLDPATRAFMEPRFGHDFSQVRVHTDAKAAESARAVNALAYTVGRDVVFGTARYAPETTEGKKLLAHELTHVLQQQDSSSVHTKSVSEPGDALEVEADRVADIVNAGGHVGPIDSIADGAYVSRKGDGKGKEVKAEWFPWIGRIRGTYSAALRKTPHQDPADPHAGTLADLPEGKFVDVIGRKGGWLHVRATVAGKETEGYVSQELVAFDRWDIDPEAIKTGLTMREALVVLKRAETHKKADTGYKPSIDEKTKIDAAIATVKGEPKYQVDEANYQIMFAKKAGSKIKIRTIEDFVLFVEAVEAQYPGASVKEVVSEIRQLWFSDVNWELLVGSEGIKEKGKYVDIETLPNPIAGMFDMADLAPLAGGKVIATPMGDVNIGHVLTGIDARLSGAPASYPKDYLKAQGHDSGEARFKYEKLKDFSSGDPTVFATFAGDLGQAFAHFIYDRYEKGDDSAKLWMYINEYAKPAALLGDIHGYIAAGVAADVRASGTTPTGGEVKASSIIRDMYLVDKSTTGTTYEQYLQKILGKTGGELKQYIYTESLNFAHVWYAKLVFDNVLEIWSPADLFDDYVREFSERADKHEMSAEPSDTLSGAVDDLLAKATAKLK